MRPIRIYQPGVYQAGQILELSPAAAQHVAVVLRMRAGESLTLFCGDNWEFDAIIDSIKKKQVFVSIKAAQEKSRESPLVIHLAQAISKGDRMEWVMQKSAELGVASITPLITERCSVTWDAKRLEKKLHQWNAIVIAACEQSGRNIVPKVQPCLTWVKYLETTHAKQMFILDPCAQATWRDYSIGGCDITLLVGPEGGFAPKELTMAYEHQCAPLSLGPRILRTETAAITALSILQAIGGDL